MTEPNAARPPSRRPALSRRAALLATATVVTGAASASWLASRARRAGGWLLRVSTPDPVSATRATTADVRRVAVFTGALVGRRLDEDEVALLARRFGYIAERDHRKAGEYAMLAAFVDRAARHHGAESFELGTDDQRERIVMGIMTGVPEGRRALLLEFISADVRVQRRIRGAMTSDLRGVYRRSAVPWRRRGYTGAPGAPASPLDYTRPGPASPC